MTLIELRPALAQGKTIALKTDSPPMTEVFVQAGQFFRRLIGRQGMRPLPVCLTFQDATADNWEIVNHVVAREVTAEDLRDAYVRLMNRPGLRALLEKEPDLPEYLACELGLGPR
jgi:hypothetical protein